MDKCGNAGPFKYWPRMLSSSLEPQTNSLYAIPWSHKLIRDAKTRMVFETFVSQHITSDNRAELLFVGFCTGPARTSKMRPGDTCAICTLEKSHKPLICFSPRACGRRNCWIEPSAFWWKLWRSSSHIALSLASFRHLPNKDPCLRGLQKLNLTPGELHRLT